MIPLVDLGKELIALIGGSGGLLYYVDRVRNRSRLRVRILRELPDSSMETSTGDVAFGHYVEFEAQNLGAAPMSLEPTVTMVGLDLQFRWHRYEMTVDPAADRTLPPHTPRRLSVLADLDPVFPYLWYRTYTFRATRGGARRIRLRHRHGPPLSTLQSFCERHLMRWGWARDRMHQQLRRTRAGPVITPPPGSPSLIDGRPKP